MNGSHVVLFERWTGAVGGDFFIYEQTPPHTMHRKWSQTSGRNLSNYQPYRYVNVIDSAVTGSLGDLDNAGRADMLAMVSNGDLYVYPNVGASGSTVWGSRYLVCSGCGDMDSLNVADLSNDGKADLVVREASTGNIYVYPNTGSPGTTTWGARYLVCGICGSFTAVNLGDLNTDGTVDMMVREPDGDLYVYPNTGSTGTTTWGARYLVCTGCDTLRDIN